MKISLFIGMALWTSVSSEALAIQFSLFGGQARVINNELLASDEGVGLEGSARAAYTFGQSGISSGLAFSMQNFEVRGDLNAQGVKAEERGTFDGQLYGAFVELSPSTWALRPLLRFGAFTGSYRYRLDAKSELDTKPTLETSSTTAIDLVTSGLELGLGLAWGTVLGASVEYKETREIAEVVATGFRYENRVDGTLVPPDGGDTGTADQLKGLVGRRFSVATRAVLAGVFWRF